MNPTAHKRGKFAIELGALALFVALLASALLAGQAGAAEVRLFEEDFGSVAQPAFGNPTGMAVDSSTGDLLVIDTAAKTVSRWNADGTPSNFSALGTNVIDGEGVGDQTPSGEILGSSSPRDSQIAVDDSGGVTDGNIYVTNVRAHIVDVFAASGEFLGQLTKYVEGAAEKDLGETCGVAVDGDGAVYVSDYTNDQIHKFIPSTNLPTSADNSVNFPSIGACTLAAGIGPSDGLLFVTNFNFGSLLMRDSASGEEVCRIEPGTDTEDNPKFLVTTVTVNPANGHLTAVRNSNVSSSDMVEYAVSGACVSEVSTGQPSAGFFQGVASSGASDRLYLSRSGKSQVEVYALPVALASVTTEPASAVDSTLATLNGSVDPEGVELDECRFEYVADADYDPEAAEPYAAGATAPCAQSPAQIGTGSDPVPVHADVAGLETGVLYHFRLVAVNAGGPSHGEDRTFATRVPPTIEDEWVARVTRGEATLKARIDPGNFPTTFRIEYGPDATYGQSTGELEVGSAASRTVTVTLAGLEPGTTYHWRVIAINENGEDESGDAIFSTYATLASLPPCPNGPFRFGPGAKLPDCRAYEMVSPVDKNGGDIIALGTPGAGTSGYFQAAIGGDRITYTSATSFGDAQRGAYANQYLATRGTSGWTSHGIHPLQGTTVFDANGITDLGLRATFDLGNSFQAFSQDLCFALMQDQNNEPLTADAIPGYTNAYLRDNCGAGADGYEAITRGAPPTSSGFGVHLWLEARAYTSDLNHVVFSSTSALTDDAAPAKAGINQLYIYDFVEEELRLVSKRPDGKASQEYAAIGTGGPRREATLARAVAADGSRVFWTDGPVGAANDGGNLYVRENPGEEQSLLDGGGKCTETFKACTVAIHEGLPLARFWIASTDGSVAVFSAGGELYEFDVETEAKTLIAGEAGGVVGASEDLSHLYFTSKEALAGAGQNEREEEAQAGEWNLYLRRGVGLDFIATITAEDRTVGRASIDSPFPQNHSSRVTPDGRHLAFMSTRPLTGYDNTDVSSGEADREVFHYAANSGDLICVSCNPSGARPQGHNAGIDNSAANKRWLAAWIPPWEWSNYGARSLTDDGNRIFFNAFDALVPEDVNGAQDVYQWEAPGTGGCDVGDADYFASNEGCVSLISHGHGGDSELIDASASGRDVFIRTGASLDPRDPGSVDLYDAREGGGFPPPAPEATPCVGDACQPIPVAPLAKSPSSAAYQGPGNPVSKQQRKRCGKGKRRVRRKGKARCVAKRPSRRTTNRNRRARR